MKMKTGILTYVAILSLGAAVLAVSEYGRLQWQISTLTKERDQEQSKAIVAAMFFSQMEQQIRDLGGTPPNASTPYTPLANRPAGKTTLPDVSPHQQDSAADLPSQFETPGR